VVNGGRARLRQVGIGQRGTDYAEVLTGVAVGDTVIQFPSDLVADGVRVATSD
jgi:HlyD family secretion protein